VSQRWNHNPLDGVPRAQLRPRGRLPGCPSMESTGASLQSINWNMNCFCHLNVMNPLARGRGTCRPIKYVLMVMVRTTMRGFIVIRDRARMHSPLTMFILSEWYCRPPSQAAKGEVENQCKPTPICIPLGTFTMPRLRGNSRRGAAWYRAESRRKRIQNFERALALASIQTKWSPWSPPMAVVE